MSVLQHREAIDDPDLQVWNNAAFDNEVSDLSASIKASWCPLKPIFNNQSSQTTLDSNSCKENTSPQINKSLPSVNSPMPIKSLQSSTHSGNTQGKPLKLLFKQGLLSPISPVDPKNGNRGGVHDSSKIDTQIEEIEMEINRLSSKLEALRLEKAEQNLKTATTRGRVISAKFMEPKQSSRKSPAPKKIGETLANVHRRGVSLGPSEVVAGVRSRPIMKPETTPIQSTQFRRKSCLWKIQEMNEEKVTKERGGGEGRSLSLSPLPRRPVSKKQGFMTVGCKKPVKKEEQVMASVQPKKLFKEGERSVGVKKHTSRNVRVVASRYNQAPPQSGGVQRETPRRKDSLPGNGEESRKIDRKRASSVGKSRAFQPECKRSNVAESRVRNRWEIPGVVTRDINLVSTPTSILKMAEFLPQIRIVRSIKDSSPRDSGAAKKVAELAGKKSLFGAEEEKAMQTSVCQVLKFDEE